MSGPRAVEIGGGVFRPARGDGLGAAQSHTLTYGHVVDPDSGTVVDEVLAAVMRAPSTYTTEDVVELHCHGGPAAQRAVLRLLLARGARPAEAGEFTKRAFLGGRIDLTQAESVGEIVQAQSAGSLRAAVHQLEGGLSGRLGELRAQLVGVLARMEAVIDFSDEDIDTLDRTAITRELAAVQAELDRLLETAFVGRALEHGLSTAIVGRPNVGKSSLLNAILMRERAIVSDLPGTTRDTVEELVEWAGVPLRLVDTAGLRTGGDDIERLGVERSRKALAEADLALAVFDVAEGLDAEDRLLLEELERGRTVLIANKVDLLAGEAAGGDGGGAVDSRMRRGCSRLSDELESAGLVPGEWRIVGVSASTGAGLEALKESIEQIAGGGHGLHLDQPILATERQRLGVQEAATAVGAALHALGRGAPDELVCEDVRKGSVLIGGITGEDVVGDLLDEIFTRFCIGK